MRAMGAAIEKAVRLALELQRRNYSIGILTGTTEVVDDVIPDDHVISLLCFLSNGRIWNWTAKQGVNQRLNFELTELNQTVKLLWVWNGT